MFGNKIYRMVDFLSVVNTFLIASSTRNEVYLRKTVLPVSKAEDNIKSIPTWHKKQIKLQNSHMQKEKK